MPKGAFDAEGFFGALDAHRVSRGMNWRQVATESGVSSSTLTRMAQGRRPDVDTLAALLAWSGESADSFMVNSDAKFAPNPLATMTAQFRADPKLPQEAKEAIETTIKVLYEQFARQEEPE
ncbi:helix-turn-helix transcriptional regulator [bacterium]|nr:helix-turn-helix transcriptional regulator [bacterium]